MTRRCPPLAVILLVALVGPLNAQQFGGALAVSGDHVLVGETGNEMLPGIVYVFAARAGTWSEVAQLTAGGTQGGPDGFGRALATSGDEVLVGAPMAGAAGGAVYVLNHDGRGLFSESGRLVAADGTEGDGFGSAVVAGEGVALVSAPGQGDGAGAVYVFTRASDGTWTESSKLVAEDEAVMHFGSSLAIEGNAALIGAAGQGQATGVVYAFARDERSGAWEAETRLETDGLGEGAGAGAALGLREGLALVGAPGASRRSGAVLVFGRDENSGAWMLQSVLSPFEMQANVRFGSSIGFDGGTVWVGAPGDGSGAGAFFVFERDVDGSWSSATRLTAGGFDGRAAFASTVTVDGALAVAGATGVDSGEGAAVILERTDAGEWEERGTVVNEMKGYPAISGEMVLCSDDTAAGFECGNVDVVSFLPVKDIGGSRGTRVNDIWGWTDPATGGEFVMVGRSNGTSFVDISDPGNPVYLGDLPMTEGANTSIWRDIKVYMNHAFIVADAAGAHGVQVFDLTQLRDVRDVPVTFEETARYSGIFSAHNIAINEETGFAYALGSGGGGETCGGGLHMIDIREPTAPAFAGCFAHAETGRRNTGYAHDAQCVVYHGPDGDYEGREICLGSNETALSIADVTDKANPVPVSKMSYPNVAYTHQGWLSDDHRYFYLNDEGDEPQGLVPGTRTLVWDVTDLDDPVLVREYIAETTTTDHNLYVRGDLMYQSNYGSGLRILDISDPVNPVEIGFFDTTPYGGGGSWSNYPYFESGVIVFTSMSEGLFVVRARPRSVMQ